MKSEHALERQILAYLQVHPQAGDTLAGIAKWWLMCHQVDESVLLVKRALDVLKTNGDILERPLPDGNNLYVLNEPGTTDANDVGAKS